jgi:hypothetical protein
MYATTNVITNKKPRKDKHPVGHYKGFCNKRVRHVRQIMNEHIRQRLNTRILELGNMIEYTCTKIQIF